MSSTPYPPDLTQQQVLGVNARLERWLHDRVGPPTLADPLKPPNQAVVDAVRGLFNLGRDPDDPAEVLGRGDPLSTITRLPLAWGNTLLQFVCGQRPYHDHQVWLDLACRLVNAGPAPLTVIVAVQTNFVLDPSTNAETDEWDKVQITREIDPGEEFETYPERALLILHRQGYAAKRPGALSRGAHRPAEQTIREIGYRATWRDDRGQNVTVDSRAWQLEQTTLALDSSRELLKAKKRDDALARLRLAQPWWPRPEGYADLLRELEAK